MNETNTVRVLLADDHQMVRDGLRAVLERQGIQVVGEASNGREVLERWHETHPDIVLMDVGMPELNGIDSTRKLLAEAPGAKVIGLSMDRDRRHVVAMFAAGASAYVLKSSGISELLQAIHEVAAGRKYVSPTIAGLVVESLVEHLGSSSTPRVPACVTATTRPLSAREREVLQLLAEGASSKQIAARLNVAVVTVETHRRQIMDKLGLRTVAELTKYAVREGLTTLE
jgi:DNA-binding NarL/FixJ family response regulator